MDEPGQMSMNHKVLFRTLIATSLVCSLVGSAVGFLPIEIPQDWRSVLEWHGNGGYVNSLLQQFPEDKTQAAGFLTVLFSILGLIAFAEIGMFLFWRAARAAYVVLTIAFALLVFIDGLVVYLPAEAALYNISLYLDGAVIAMAYLPPINARFDRKAP